MIEPRIYRAAFAPALLAVVIAMFSLQSRPAAVPQALAADVLFDGRVALADAQKLAADLPDRRPEATGDFDAAARVTSRLRSQRFDVTVDRFHDEGKDLVNVVGRRPGDSTRQIVVVAPRDSARIPDIAGSASDTAALLEIARTLQGRITQKTLVLASVDGSTLGAAGARRLASQLSAAGPVETVIVLSDLGVPVAHGSLLVPWSETTDRSGIRLQRTLGDSVRLEVERGGAGRGPGTLGQFARLAFPLGVGDQAPFLDAGVNSLRFSGSGELPPEKQQAANADRLGSLGRATLRTVFAYDAGGFADERPSSFLIVAQKVLPAWAVSLLVAALLLPLPAAAIDSFARMRRRHEPVLPWLRWIGAGMVPFLAALLLAEFLVLVGVAPHAPSVPLPPDSHNLDASGAVSLGLCAVVFALTWIFVRPRLTGPLPAPDRPGAGAALALTLCVAAFAVWAVNPFAACALLPGFHIWLLISAWPRPARRPVGAALVIAGLLLPVLTAIAVLARLEVGPLAGLWYAFLLVTGHHVGLYTTLVGAALAACFAAALRIAIARRSVSRETTGAPSVRGPGGYAGPGSLGGTDSALRL